jgi:hypothetical protein
MIWLRFIPSSMIRCVSFVAAGAALATSAAEAKAQPNARMFPSPCSAQKSRRHAHSTPAAEAQSIAGT